MPCARLPRQPDALIGIFADLQGPKIRLETFVNGEEMLTAGDRFTITTDEGVEGTKERAGTTLHTLTHDVQPGDQILINDGAIELKALEVTENDVITEVIVQRATSTTRASTCPVLRSASRHSREGRRRPALGAGEQRQHGGALLRALGQRHR